MEPTGARGSLVAAVRRVQEMTYAWPGPPEAAPTREAGRGTCAGKHAVLAEDLALLGFDCSRLMVVGPLVPGLWADLLEQGAGLQEVHECLTVETSWAGPLLLDVTWHPAAIRAGLSGTLDWDGLTDMACAVDIRICHTVRDEAFRDQKERLRNRLYTPAQRATRDGLLAEMARRAKTMQ